jgi:hypothetical protein
LSSYYCTGKSLDGKVLYSTDVRKFTVEKTGRSILFRNYLDLVSTCC